MLSLHPLMSTPTREQSADVAARRAARRARRQQRALTPEEVLRRNSVERLKAAKHPFDVRADLPRFIEMPYEEIPEDDILRLQWYGIYHDKPKVGNFMLRVKIPNGRLTARQLRVIGDLSVEQGQNSGELTTRQDIQLHWIRLASMPSVFETFEREGLFLAGGCGDNLRNVTGCPVAGIEPSELFDVRPVIDQVVRFFYGNREYGNLPRKHKYTIAACRHHCNAPEIHDVALVGVIQDGVEGFAFWVGGGLSSVPRIGQSLGVFVPKDEAFEVARGCTDIWRKDLRYRLSRAKARFKFMVDDDGPALIREKLEKHLGRRLADLREEPRPLPPTDHLGVHPQKQAGFSYLGVPVFPGLMSGEQMRQVADLMDALGPQTEFRITREQNFILSGVPTARVEEAIARLGEIGFPLEATPIRGHSIACTGDPHCNFAVGDTKPKLVDLVESLEAAFGERVNGLRVYLDGCPHACGQHWVGDIGLQGTSKRTETGKISAYDIILRGSLGPGAAIGRLLLRRIPSQQVNETVKRLIEAWLREAEPGETLPAYYRRRPDDAILALAAGETEQ